MDRFILAQFLTPNDRTYYSSFEGGIAEVVSRAALATQIGISLISLPLILATGTKDMIFAESGNKLEAAFNAADAIKDHLWHWIPSCAAGIISSKRSTAFLNSKLPILFKEQTHVDLGHGICPNSLDLSPVSKLEGFEGWGSKMTQAPDFNNNPQLRTINLSHNHLSAPPITSHNPLLTSLNLAINKLTICPNVSQNPYLQRVDLQYNELTELHDSIFNLPSNCIVNVEHNHFTPSYTLEIIQRLEFIRRHVPGHGPTIFLSNIEEAVHANHENPFEVHHSLPEAIAFWNEEGEDYSLLHQLEPENQDLLADYLEKLKEIKDFQNFGAVDKSARKNIISRVQNMLKLACTNIQFKDQLTGLLREGSESCGDRVMLIFNDIEVLTKLYEKNHTEPELAKLLVQIERYEMLKAYAKKEVREKNLEDEVQTILYYQVALRDELQLPITTKSMLFHSMAGVTPEMLSAARSEISSASSIDLLATSEFWRAHILKETPEAFDAIHRRIAKRAAFLDKQALQLSDGLYNQQYRALDTQRNAAMAKKTKRITKKMNLILSDLPISNALIEPFASGVRDARLAEAASIVEIPHTPSWFEWAANMLPPPFTATAPNARAFSFLGRHL